MKDMLMNQIYDMVEMEETTTPLRNMSLKNVYKALLKEIDVNNTSNLIQEFVGIIYKLGYIDMVDNTMSNLISSFDYYIKGDSNRYYNQIKKWITSISDIKNLMMLYNCVNLGMKNSLWLDNMEHSDELDNTILSTLPASKIIEGLENIFDSEELLKVRYSTKLEFTGEEKYVLDVLRSNYFEFYCDPDIEIDIDYFNSIFNDNKLGYTSGKILDIFMSISAKRTSLNRKTLDILKEVYKIYSDNNGVFNAPDLDGEELVYDIERRTSNKHNKHQLFDLYRAYLELRYSWEFSTKIKQVKIIDLFLNIFDKRDIKICEVLCIKEYLERDEIIKKVKDKKKFNSICKYLDKLYGRDVSSSNNDYLDYIQDRNNDLFNLCLAIKCCMYNNSLVTVISNNCKVDDRKIFGYIKHNSDYFLDMEKKHTNNELQDISFSRYYKEDIKFNKVISSFKKHKDLTRFEQEYSTVVGPKLLCTYVDYFFSKLQDSNIEAYIDYLSPYIFRDCMSFSYRENSMSYSCVFDSDISILMSRKYIIPTKGIIAELLGYSVYLREFDNDLGEHIISAIITEVNCSNIYSSMILNLTTGTIIGVNTIDIMIPMIQKILECKLGINRNIVNVSTSLNSDKFILTDCYDISEELVNADINIISPYYWRYKNNYVSKKSLGSHSPVTSDKEIVINAFIRRLPKSSVASKDRQKLAKKYCIKLEKGYTIVDTFTRNVK